VAGKILCMDDGTLQRDISTATRTLSSRIDISCATVPEFAVLSDIPSESSISSNLIEMTL
jgi:hypothetical protein